MLPTPRGGAPQNPTSKLTFANRAGQSLLRDQPCPVRDVRLVGIVCGAFELKRLYTSSPNLDPVPAEPKHLRHAEVDVGDSLTIQRGRINEVHRDIGCAPGQIAAERRPHQRIRYVPVRRQAVGRTICGGICALHVTVDGRTDQNVHSRDDVRRGSSDVRQERFRNVAVSLLGLSGLISQSSLTRRPVLVPPCTVSPFAIRATTLTSKPCQYSICFPKSDEGIK